MTVQLTDIASYIGLTKRREESLTEVNDKSKTPKPESYGEKIIELVWTTQDRVVKEITPKTAKTLIIIGVAVSLVFALMQEFVFILVIASLGFLAYMLTKNPTTQVQHEISSHGINYGGNQFYYWHELKQFFFQQDGEHIVLCVDTVEKIPGRLFMEINTGDRERIKEILSKRLIYKEEAPKYFIDKVYDAAVSKLDLK